MPQLTRRRPPDHRHECWHVFYGDVHVGVIALRAGIPHDEDPWGWNCGIYPGSHPGEHTNGAAPTFNETRRDFESAWSAFLSRRTEADFRAWREAQALTAWKYKMWDAGCRMPTQNANGRSKCFCGATIAISDTSEHVCSAHMEMAE